MKRFARALVSHLTPATHDIICGVGLGFDPIPCNSHETFIDSDFAAFKADAEALYLDWCCVQGLLADRAGHQPMEARYHGHERSSERQARRRERELA
jgi:hypothetical protein